MGAGGVIRITPDEMDTIAGRFDTESSNIATMISNLQGQVSTLEQGWEGMARTSFSGVWPNHKQNMQQLQELLGQISSQLKTTASNMRQADQSSAGQFGGR